MDIEGIILGDHRHKESLFGDHEQLNMDGDHLALACLIETHFLVLISEITFHTLDQRLCRIRSWTLLVPSCCQKHLIFLFYFKGDVSRG